MIETALLILWSAGAAGLALANLRGRIAGPYWIVVPLCVVWPVTVPVLAWLLATAVEGTAAVAVTVKENEEDD